MSEAFRNRHAFDLDEIERQIREASSRPAGSGKPVEDPLAELARIVSGDPRARREPTPEARVVPAPIHPTMSPRDLSDAVAREFAGRVPANEAYAQTVGPAQADGSLSDDIERLLSRDQRAVPAAEMPVHPDEFAEVMRSFDRIVERQEPQFQSYTASAQATPAPADM
ncbi:MAG: hypothetical protein ACRCUX_00490, partial [Beijerinckiaceae bacterium]